MRYLKNTKIIYHRTKISTEGNYMKRVFNIKVKYDLDNAENLTITPIDEAKTIAEINIANTFGQDEGYLGCEIECKDEEDGEDGDDFFKRRHEECRMFCQNWSYTDNGRVVCNCNGCIYYKNRRKDNE